MECFPKLRPFEWPNANEEDYTSAPFYSEHSFGVL